jgi:hypothetical protein
MACLVAKDAEEGILLFAFPYREPKEDGGRNATDGGSCRPTIEGECSSGARFLPSPSLRGDSGTGKIGQQNSPGEPTLKCERARRHLEDRRFDGAERNRRPIGPREGSRGRPGPPDSDARPRPSNVPPTRTGDESNAEGDRRRARAFSRPAAPPGSMSGRPLRSRNDRRARIGSEIRRPHRRLGATDDSTAANGIGGTVSRREDKPAANFATRQALVGIAAIGETYHSIDQGRLERWIVKERGKSLKRGRRRDCIPLTRIDSEQLALVMIKIQKVEADPPVANRCDLDLSAAMP